MKKILIRCLFFQNALIRGFLRNGFLPNVIQKIILNVQRNKKLDILGIIEVNACISIVNNISAKLKETTDNMTKITNEIIIGNLQTINNELVNAIKIYGTDSLEDLLTICFGNISSIMKEEEDISKFELLKLSLIHI